mgnify:CR=1 FL=1
MTPFERLINSLASFHFSFSWFFIFKGFLLLGVLFYFAFGIIVIRQVSLMSKTLSNTFNSPIRVIAWIHLGLILGLFLTILLIF